MDFLTDPWSWWVEPFIGSEANQNALAAVLLTALCTSVVGTWVVLRGMSFLGDALAHGVLPGLALAFVLGADPTIGAFVAAIAMVAGVNVVRAASPLPDDASIGILFVGFLALAVVVMSSEEASYTGDLTRFLFGSITGVDTGDLRRQVVFTVVAVVVVAVLYRALLVGTFDERQAQVLGMHPRLVHAALLVLLALAIVASFSTVGNLLVFAFLIAPPATATLLVRRVPAIMALGVVIGAASGLVGLLISYHHETAAGATMALCTVVVFFAALLARWVATLVRRRAVARPLPSP
jgi:ABC-type Mn2+/Zn2+ transport system permease subunit